MGNAAQEIDLDRWESTIDAGNLTIEGIGRAYDISANSLHKWLAGERKPRATSVKKMEEILNDLQKTKRIPYHPSFGYATSEQIARLKESISEMEREKIMTQITKQSRTQGKVD